MKLIVGLGNPGPKYENTRHNLGFMALDELVSRHRASCGPEERRANAVTCRISVRGVSVTLAKPLTYMNLSGTSVRGLVRELGVDKGDLIVVHDDLDLPLGAMKIKKDGGDGGHNGIASVIQELGTREFSRVRLGIGRPPGLMEPVEYVLTTFLPEEEEAVKEVLGAAADALTVMVRDGFQRAMNLFNRKPGKGPKGAGEEAKGAKGAEGAEGQGAVEGGSESAGE